MNATSLYVTTSRLVFQNDFGSTGLSSSGSVDPNWTDLYRLLPYLRQSLSCSVCGRILCEPYRPVDGKCQHHICKLCVLGRKNLKPSCPYCISFDLSKYEENIQMRVLLQCYKSLCQHILTTPFFNLICKQSRTNGCATYGVIPNASLADFIEEGANFEDNFKANSGLTKSSYSILPCIFNPPPSNGITIQPSTAVQNTNSSQSVQTTQHKIIQHSLQTSPPPPPLTLVNNKCNVSNNQQMQQPSLPQIVAISGTSLNCTASNIVQFQNQKLILNKQLQNNIVKKISTERKLINTSSSITLNSMPGNSKLNFPNNKISIKNSNTNISNILNHQQPNKIQNVQINNPPSIKTVSNGAAMYSVLYTGIGNKITIKRKTDGDDEASTRKYSSIPEPPPRPPQSNNNINNNNKYPKRRGCRCGNATAAPGKLTCCGQRCPCYVDSKSCIDCKCRGCRNPHRPGGGKVRPLIPELACYEIQVADDTTNGSMGTNNNNILTNSTNLSTSNISNNIIATSTSSTTSPINDFNTVSTRLNNIIGNNTVTTFSTNSGQIIKKKQRTVTFGTNQLKQTIKLENNHQQQSIQHQQQPSESLLIKSADGKYQVVNLYTPTASNLQRFQTVHQTSQIQNNSSTSSAPTTTTLQHNFNHLINQTNSNHQTNFITTTTTGNSGINNYHIIQSQQQNPTTITLSPIIVGTSPTGLDGMNGSDMLNNHQTGNAGIRIIQSPNHQLQQHQSQLKYHSNLQHQTGTTSLDSGD